MQRTKSETVKSTTSANVTQPQTPKVKSKKAPVVVEEVQVQAPAQVQEKRAKVEKGSSKPKSAQTVKVEVLSAVVVPEPVLQSVEVLQNTEFSDFVAKLQLLGNLVSKLKTDFKVLEKKANRDMKNIAKASIRRKNKNVNRAPSGFVKPTTITQELALFLGKQPGVQMARTEVTREINAYIRANNLQDKENGRIINADAKMKTLLKIPEGESLTYFNLQRYMSPHFTKAVVAVALPTA
jgi:upstream activation factor subunit UAF30